MLDFKLRIYTVWIVHLCWIWQACLCKPACNTETCQSCHHQIIILIPTKGKHTHRAASFTTIVSFYVCINRFNGGGGQNLKINFNFGSWLTDYFLQLSLSWSGSGTRLLVCWPSNVSLWLSCQLMWPTYDYHVRAKVRWFTQGVYSLVYCHCYCNSFSIYGFEQGWIALCGGLSKIRIPIQ